VIQHVREKFACWDCEKITQPPAPFHVIPGPGLDPAFWPGSCSRSSASISP
jgi:transposase